MSDDPLEWGAKPVEEDPTSWGAKPVESAPKSDFSWSKAVTDIPHEIYQEGANAAGNIGALAHRSEMGPVEGLMATGKAALAVPRMIAAPITGAARSVLGHGMANIEHGVTSLINPDIAAKQDPEQMYEESKGDVDKAMMAARPAGAPIKVPGPVVTVPHPNPNFPGSIVKSVGKPAYEWQAPAPKIKPTGVVEQPETSDFFDSADKRYNNMRGYGVEFDKKPIAGIADNAVTELESDGYRDYLAPKTYKALDELRNVKGQNATISDIEGVRKLLNKVRKDPAERDAAATAVSHIDDYLTNLHNNSHDVVVNPHFADRISEEAKAARSDWGAAKRSAAIDESLERAENAASVHGNIGHQIQLQLKNLRNNRREMKFWTDSEKTELDAAIKGTTVSKMAKQAGKFSPHGVVSTAGAIALGHAVMPGVGGVAVPAAGFVAKKIANYMARGRAENLGNYVKGRSALGRETSTNAATQAATKAVSKSSFSRPSITSGVAASLPRLTVRPSIGQIQGLVPSTAEEQQKGRGGRNNKPYNGANKKRHMGGAIRRAIKGYAEGGSPELSEEDQAAMSPETYANPFVKGAISGVASLPRRAIENSQYSLDTGNYDPSVPMEAAMTMTGGAGIVPAESNSLRAGIRTYKNVPQSLMGFRRSGPQRGFEGERYPHTQDVAVTLPATSYAPQETFRDQIKGMNADHAIERAYRNWPDALHITPVGRAIRGYD